MSQYRPILITLLIRALIASPCFIIGMLTLLHARGGLFGGVGFALIGFAFFILGAIIMAPAVARLFAEPVGNLYWPGGTFDRPQPMYGIPQTKRAKGLYEEALADLEKMTEAYPDLVKPYMEMLDIAIVNLNDAQRANAIYQRGIARLEKTEDKEMLARMYGALRTRLRGSSENPRGSIPLRPDREQRN